MPDIDPLMREVIRERREDVREIDFHFPRESERDMRPGVVMEMHVNAQTSNSIDLNVNELRAWAHKMLQFADRATLILGVGEDDLDPFTGERVPCVVCSMGPQRGGTGCCSIECFDGLAEAFLG